MAISHNTNYLTSPTYKLTNEEALRLAQRQAVAASLSTRIIDGCEPRRMTGEEVKEYALAVYASILYFNKRDPRHDEEMRYSALCQREDELRQAAESVRPKKTKVRIL